MKYVIVLLLVAVTALCVGCGAFRAGQEDAEPGKDEINARKIAQLERLLDMQTSQLGEIQQSIVDMSAKRTARAGMVDIIGAGTFDTLITEEVHFKLNQFSLDDEDRAVLDRVAVRMAEVPSSILYIFGHTDLIGNVFYNQQLSRQRADAALRYLVERYDVPLHRMEALGFGTDRQKYTNDTGVDENKNRRIDILLLEKTAEEPVTP
jgi:outer membrane protein OmpA-like peptidoglycan-associated protein